jgi:hypothetical protein
MERQDVEGEVSPLITRAPAIVNRKIVPLYTDSWIDRKAEVRLPGALAAISFNAKLHPLELAIHVFRAWFKLSAPYRVSTHPPGFPDVTPLAQALLAAAPDRCVWGTDWPPPNATFMPNDGDLVDLLANWVPDEALRHRVLVENPAWLYRIPFGLSVIPRGLDV